MDVCEGTTLRSLVSWGADRFDGALVIMISCVVTVKTSKSLVSCFVDHSPVSHYAATSHRWLSMSCIYPGRPLRGSREEGLEQTLAWMIACLVWGAGWPYDKTQRS